MAGKWTGAFSPFPDGSGALPGFEWNPRTSKAYSEGRLGNVANGHLAGSDADIAYQAGAANPADTAYRFEAAGEPPGQLWGENPLQLPDPGFIDGTGWNLTGGATITGGQMTLPVGSTATASGLPFKPGYTYRFDFDSALGGNLTIQIGGGDIENPKSNIWQVAGAANNDLVLTNTIGTPVIPAPIALVEILPILFAIHPDPNNTGGLFPDGIYDPAAAAGGYPIWPGDGTVQIQTHTTTGNGTASIDPTRNDGTGILGIVPGQSYRMSWAGITNPDNTSLQVDLAGGSVEGNFGTPAFIDMPGDLIGGTGPGDPTNLKYAGDANASGGQDGIVTLTGPMTLQWIEP